MGEARSAHVQIELSAPRAVFAELLAGALDHAAPPPTPVAIAYLIDLLDERVRAPEPAALAIDSAALLAGGGGEPDAVRLVRLRGLGDAALFIAGFFGESLARAPFGPAPTSEAGRRAYGALAAAMTRLAAERTWSRLYEELADRFRDFADLLAEVGERTRGGAAPGLAGLYSRFLATGSERDRRRLVCRGALAPELGGLLRPQ
jgi:hypothetical protein